MLSNKMSKLYIAGVMPFIANNVWGASENVRNEDFFIIKRAAESSPV